MSVKIKSKYRSNCKLCKGEIRVNDMCYWTPGEKGVTHAPYCPDVASKTPALSVERRINLERARSRKDFPMLFKHQQEIVNTVEKNPDAKLYLAFAAGLGKTLTSLAAAEVSNSFPLVVVCPSIVKINWQREAERWIGKEAQILSSRTPSEITSDVVIINYEVLEYWLDEIIDMNPKGVIFDEFHYAKNPTSKRTKAVLELAKSVDGMRIGLSGTPTPNSVYDLVAPLDALGVLDDFGGRKNYIDRYCPPVQTRYGVSYSRSLNERELYKNLINVGFVRRRREDCLDLPEKIISEIPVRVKIDENMKFYNPLLAKMESATLSEAIRVLKEESSADLAYEEFLRERRAVGEAKVQHVVDLAGDTDEPLIIMVHHKSVASELMDKLKKRKPVKLVGGMTPKARQASIDAFQSGKTDVMICSIDAAGIGINLQRGTQMIFAELPYTYAKVEQAESRCHRAGAKNDLNVQRLLAIGTSDEMIMGIINKKEAQSAAVEDGLDIDPKTYGNVVARKLVRLYKEKK